MADKMRTHIRQALVYLKHTSNPINAALLDSCKGPGEEERAKKTSRSGKSRRRGEGACRHSLSINMDEPTFVFSRNVAGKPFSDTVKSSKRLVSRHQSKSGQHSNTLSLAGRPGEKKFPLHETLC